MTESTLPRLFAIFSPERIINDATFSVDEEIGERQWDCTAYVLSHIKHAHVNEVLGFRSFFENAEGYDDRDWVARDPAAPAWIHDWAGPFEVEVEGTGEFLAYHGIDLAELTDDKVVPLLEMLRDLYPLPEPDYRPTPGLRALFTHYRAVQKTAADYLAFPMSFGPAHNAVQLLAKIAVSTSSHANEAREVLANWKATLATAEQIDMVETNDELEVDDTGACVSEGDGGFFIQTWTWVPGSPEDCIDEDGEPLTPAERERERVLDMHNAFLEREREKKEKQA